MLWFLHVFAQFRGIRKHPAVIPSDEWGAGRCSCRRPVMIPQSTTSICSQSQQLLVTMRAARVTALRRLDDGESSSGIIQVMDIHNEPNHMVMLQAFQVPMFTFPVLNWHPILPWSRPLSLLSELLELVSASQAFQSTHCCHCWTWGAGSKSTRCLSYIDRCNRLLHGRWIIW